MKLLNHSIVIVLAGLLLACSQPEKLNQKQLFDFDWQFTQGEAADCENPNFIDKDWQTVNLPHDWSIQGSFSKDNPSFSRGGWLPTGKCAYRKSFDVDAGKKDQRFVIYFDGAYRNSEVYINGNLLGKRPLGYISFYYDMTPHINFGGSNVITVKLDNSSQPGSRWYSGTGIYRHVHLITTNKIYIPIWGNYIVANDADKEKAKLSIETKVQNDDIKDANYKVVYTVYNQKGIEVAKADTEQSVKARQEKLSKTEIVLVNPTLWNPENPHLYSVKTDIITDGNIIHSQTDKTGVRNLAYDNQNGFFLNGKNIKLKGVCLHHAGGPLGSAIYRRTTERQLEKLREMGCNAVRTSHNPFSEEFLNVCDSMGFLVMNEMFDEWEHGKSPATTQNGKKIRIPVDFYAKEFKEWSDRDLTDFLLRDRNHPSVVMWSTGNEIDEMKNEKGAPIGKRLADIIHKYDYRPLTNGVNGYAWNSYPTPEAEATSDIYGYNYIQDADFTREREKNPDAMVVVTECSSQQAFYPRGTYLFGDTNKKVEQQAKNKPVVYYPKEGKKEWWDKLEYEETDAYAWVEERRYDGGDRGMGTWSAVKKRPYVMGLFIWTGWDYLGEVIPFGWPARSSSFAPIDLCGFPKDGYYFYQSQWSDEPMVHIFPHWNLKGMEGKPVTVHGYTNGDEVELFQDGKSLGKKPNNREGVEYQSWDVVYQPGELKAVSYLNGKVHSEKIVKTAGEAATIKIETRRQSMKANAQDLIYVECTILDKDGNEVPTANNMMEFSITGPAEIAGVGNGDNMCLEPFKATNHSAFNGKCLAIIQSTKEAGAITVTATSAGLESTTVQLESK
ncbi:glycoside hydrolase family 2 TIM barrel-domain containing protein [Labilibacter marinus]|uniref:glycoside hydrolase family 2 TIM barrel-domain containing protein n=1 Tax=Labilibacter marinus TaxID=1477105 RepID=UPI000835FAA4|nr:glycoside hydrolase family 2 TIM barrel-domain containing protein [Labilibacter marinus]